MDAYHKFHHLFSHKVCSDIISSTMFSFGYYSATELFRYRIVSKSMGKHTHIPNVKKALRIDIWLTGYAIVRIPHLFSKFSKFSARYTANLR